MKSVQGKAQNVEMAADQISADELRLHLQRLTGQALPTDSPEVLEQVAASMSSGKKIGYSQFNELLLNVGYDRVDVSFFLYLCDPHASEVEGASVPHEIQDVGRLIAGIEAFRILALLLYGNVKHGFKTLSRDSKTLSYFVKSLRRERSDDEFRRRHGQLVDLKPVDAQKTYLLGYLSAKNIKARLEENPHDTEALELDAQQKAIIGLGTWNHAVYLTSDHLDLYVATSMREKHEFMLVNEFINRLMDSDHVKELKIRLFDPTQAYCIDRVDTGLAEALMLKRARCTIYLAQESDTLGKDSELASTLAQGKPVIAFVPEVTDEFFATVRGIFNETKENHETEHDVLMRLLRIYEPDAAWTDKTIRDQINAPVSDVGPLVVRVRAAMTAHYDKRAKMLKQDHPLGLQTNLNTGVANGVLVARTVETCARLLSQILLNRVSFRVEDKDGYVFLREKLRDCVFRVMTADKLLTNSFWNFYNSP